MTAIFAIDTRAVLGEGPFWNHDQKAVILGRYFEKHASHLYPKNKER